MTNEALKAAQLKNQALREAGITIERLDPIERAKQNPSSKALAIKAKCWDCVCAGEDANPRQAIRECAVTACPLHPVRPFQVKDAKEDEQE